jgi:hypothetical protein
MLTLHVTHYTLYSLYSRHLKLTLKAPFGGMADLASGMAGHQCQYCAKAHVGSEQSKLGDAMGSMLKVKHQLLH